MRDPLLHDIDRKSIKNEIIWEWPGRKLTIGKKTLIMGILNITPDSFSDEGKFFDAQKALEHALKMVGDGVDIIDVGGESTRPGSVPVTAEEELARVMPVLEILLKEIPVPISLDTYKASVAEKALALGVQIINDVGGGIKDPHMAEVVAAFQSPVIVMHNPDEPNYHDLIPDVIGSLAESIRVYEQAGNLPEKIVIDPGIGFGKNHEENLTILKGLKDFQILGKPILLGVSRKSFIGRILDIPAGERVEGSLAAAAWGIVKDVNILRVHDVLETVRLARVLEAIKEAGEHIE